MKTKFPKLTGCYVATAIGTPILFFFAFICYAGGHYGWTAILWLIAVISSLLFPFSMVGRSTPKKRSLKDKILFGLHFAAAYLLYTWLSVYVIDIESLFLKFRGESPLLDWQPVLAIGIWTGLTIFKGLLFIDDLSDEMIFKYLNGADSKKADAPNLPKQPKSEIWQ